MQLFNLTFHFELFDRTAVPGRRRRAAVEV